MIADPSSVDTEATRTHGNFESFAAGPALVRTAEEVVRKGRAPAGFQPRTAREVLHAADEGNAAARTAVAQTAQAVGRSVATIVSLLNPDVVVLGGGLGNATPVFRDTARRIVSESAQPVAARVVRIEQAKLGDDAFLVGVAEMVFQATYP